MRYAILVVAGMTLFATAARMQTRPGTATNDAHERKAAKQFVGTWRLVSNEQRLDDGSTKQLWGPHGVGYLIYTDTNHMCIVEMNPDRPKWNSTAVPTSAEVMSAFDGLSAYCGTYEVNEEQRYVIHHVEIEKTPNFVGQVRKRWYTFSGNRVTLRREPSELPKGVAEQIAIFERVTNRASAQPTKSRVTSGIAR